MSKKLRRSTSSGAAMPEALVPPCGCDKDPAQALIQMFVEVAQAGDLAAGRDPATRPVFLRLHGVVHGAFAVQPGLPEDLRVGVFGKTGAYPAWVRFSSDVQPGSPDYKGTIGIAIKLFGVPGKKLLSPDEDATTHDFILQNHDVFFVDTAKDMCEFTCASLNGKFDEYVAQHPVTGQILSDMEKVVDSVLKTSYWSGLPSKFGASRFVKYKIEPELAPDGSGPKPDYNDPYYLAADLHSRLRKDEARLRFFVQFQTDASEMPLDQATVRWSEAKSPPIHVATLILQKQDLDARNQSEYGENLAFNPWHALAEHEPEGSIAAARKVVYRASAAVRRNFNATPIGEPVEPRPAEWHPSVPYPSGEDTTIVRAEIHPAIGIARVGNSPDEFLIGPEVLEPPPGAPGSYRDAAGAIKRQAARFRIYGYNRSGRVVRELTADWAGITWKVAVANKKAAWYRWQMALDVPEAASLQLPRRSANVKDKDRDGLVIDGGTKSIEGKKAQGPEYEFHGEYSTIDNTGKHISADVYLGELQTDEEGRLLFLGGQGVSASPIGSPIYIDKNDASFINADGWYDDMSDGPVTAEVTIDGHPIPVQAAWVVTAPPNYAPALKGVRTLYDLLVDLYYQAGWLDYPEQVSFRDDVYPILQRFSRLQWANKGFATQFGKRSPNDFEDPGYIARLAHDPKKSPLDTFKELRRQILNSFRDPDATDNNQLPWPWIYGDAMDITPANTPRQNATVSPTQYEILRAWAKGDFEPDWDEERPAYKDVDEAPLQERPMMLTRAALDFCLADAFHPGCEVTWTVRHLTMFSAPFRIRHRPEDAIEPDYGQLLTPRIALSPGGPLHEQGPGDLTRWMGLPWQADTGFCRGGYLKKYDPYVPTFWPAHVPNNVMTENDYLVAIDTSKPRDDRLAAFADRMEWTQPLQGTTAGQMEAMVRLFGDMGLLEVWKGVEDDPDLPETMMVASFGPGIQQPATSIGAALLATETERTAHRLARQGSWASATERKAAPLPVRYPKTS